MNAENLAGVNSGESNETQGFESEVDTLVQYGKEHPFDAVQAQKLYDEEKARLDGSTVHVEESETGAEVGIIRDPVEARRLDLECADSKNGGINMASNDFRGMMKYRLIQRWRDEGEAFNYDELRTALRGAREESQRELADLSDSELKSLMMFESTKEDQADKARSIQFEKETMPIVKAGRAIRIHPYGPSSPFSSEHYNPKDGFDAQSIAFVQRIAEARRRVAESRGEGSEPMGDFTVVMNYSKSSENYPSAEDGSLDDYFEMCKDFVAQSGTNGEDLVLELGNETDVARNTTKGEAQPFNDDAFSAVSDPIAYAQMYFATTSRLKAIYPNLRFSLAGTAFYDEAWIRTVCKEVTRLSQVKGVKSQLIDVISYHDYRSSAEEPMSVVVRDGVSTRIEDTSMTYGEQIDSLEHLADDYGAKLTCGEVNFCKWEQGQVVGVNADAKKSYAHNARHESCGWRSDEQIHSGH